MNAQHRQAVLSTGSMMKLQQLIRAKDRKSRQKRGTFHPHLGGIAEEHGANVPSLSLL
jgi:hypothetical protein